MPSVVLAGLLLALPQGCGWVVGDGNYKVGSSGSASSGTSSGVLDDCDTCISQMCPSAWSACEGNSACAKFRRCEDNCATSNCNCEALYPGGAALWTNVFLCGGQCSTCSFFGIGDPCSSDNDCSALMTSTCCDTGVSSCRSWCSPPSCSKSSDCAGGTLTSTNVFGQENYCLQNTLNTNICFPGCQTNADCQAFPGTDCEAATTVDVPPQSIMICTLANTLDGGTD